MLERCLSSLAQQSLPADQFEVVVVNDGSTDDTDLFLSSARFAFTLKPLRKTNGGPSQARNTGVGVANGKFIAFTEDDVVVAQDWLQNAMKHLQEENLDLLEGSTLYQHTQEPVRRFEKVLRHSFIPCNLFIKKSLFEQVGGYDPQFYDPMSRLYFREDGDLGFRLLDAGARTKIVNDVIVEHPIQFSDVNGILRHVRRYFFDPLLYKKHPQRFRTMIEAKEIGGMTIRRPQHYVALVYCAALIALVVSLVLAHPSLPLFAGIALWCSFAFRYKYQGLHALRLHKIRETVGFLVIPIVYLYAVLRGCWRFKSFGVLL